MISNELDRKKIRDSLQEISNSMTRIAAEQDFIKEEINAISEQYEIPKKLVAKLAKIYFKQNFSVEAQAFDELETLYEEIVEMGNE